ncbi:MAG: hypothetical protein AAFY27_01855 [Pseudomonadota bacterium]
MPGRLAPTGPGLAAPLAHLRAFRRIDANHSYARASDFEAISVHDCSATNGIACAGTTPIQAAIDEADHYQGNDGCTAQRAPVQGKALQYLHIAEPTQLIFGMPTAF